MAFNNRIQTNFARGEVSPDVVSRGDIDVFSASLKMCRNFIPKFQGPVSFAAGTIFIDDSSVLSGSKLIPFVYRDTQAYQFELFVDESDNSLNIRLLSDGGVVEYSAGNTGWVRNAPYGVPCTFDFTGGAEEDIIIKTSHKFVDGDEIYFSETVVGDLPDEIEVNKKYFVINANTDYFQISEEEDGDAVEFTEDGSTGGKIHYYGDSFSDSEDVGYPIALENDPAFMTICDSDMSQCTFDATGGADENIVIKTSHGLSDGDIIFFVCTHNGVLPPEIFPYKNYYVVNADTDYFQISEEEDGDVIEFSTDGTSMTHFNKYNYGGDVILKIEGDFLASDLENIRYAQSGASMILVSEGRFCIQLWRGNTSETAWAANIATIETSPFIAIQAIEDDGNGYAKYVVAGHNLVVGDMVIIKNTHEDYDYDGAFKVTRIVDVDRFTTGQEYIGHTATSSDYARKGGTFFNFKFCFEEVTDFLSNQNDIPKEVKFNEGRLFFTKDDKMFGSRSVVDGTDMYANFNQSINAIPTDAIDTICAVSSDKVDLFKWLKTSNKQFYAGMENLIAVIQGATADEPIAGDSISFKAVESRGSSDVSPIEDGTDIIFVGSTGKVINAFKYNITIDSQRSEEQTLLVEHFFNTTIKKIVFQRGRPDKIWVLLNDGTLLGFIYKSSENISGWFKYSDAKGDIYSDISVLPVSNGVDRLWMIVSRPNENGEYADRIEQLELDVNFVQKEDFFTNENNIDDDLRRWGNAVYEQQKHAVHMHSMLYYDAFYDTEDYGHYLHVSHDFSKVFTSSDGTLSGKLTSTNSLLNGETGNHIMIKSTSNGYGEGRFRIEDYNTTTGFSNITVEQSLADYYFDVEQNSYVIPAGLWGISLDNLSSSYFERFYKSLNQNDASHIANEDCVAFWKMNEQDGNIVYDSSDNSIDGEVYGDVQVESGLNSFVKVFNGSDSKIKIPHSSKLNFGSSKDFSIASYFKTDDVGNIGNILVKFDGGVFVWLYKWTNDYLYFNVSDGVTSVQIASDAKINDGEYHLVIITGDRDGNVTMYIDDVAQADVKSIALVNNISNVGDLYIGGDPTDTNMFSGNIALVSIFDRVLTQGERGFIYNNGIGVEDLLTDGLNNAYVDVVIDGAYIGQKLVEYSDGVYNIDFGSKYGAVIYVGYKYKGVVMTLPVDIGGRTGTAFSKLKNIEQVRVDFLDSISIKYGIGLYNLNEKEFRMGSDKTDRPIQPFTGTVELENIGGGWGNKKSMCFVFDNTSPCTISAIDISGQAADEL